MSDHGETQIQREAVFEASADELWRAITDESKLSEWLAEEVELEPVPGADARFRVAGEERFGTVEVVEEGSRFAFTWARGGDPETYVELCLDSVAAGTRLRVVETVPALVDTEARATASASAAGWAPRLSLLARALTLVMA